MWKKPYYIPLMLLVLAMCSYLGEAHGQIVFINEVLTSPPAGSMTTTNANSLYNVGSNDLPPNNQEWIELYNPHPCDTVDISCYTLGCNMQPPSGSTYDNWGAFTFPAGTKIPPLGFLIIGGNYSQVPQLDFDLNYYRQNYYGSQYLSGCWERWFLRDEYGWVALYSPSGAPVDAIYWDLYGIPSNLYSQPEYQSSIVSTTTCSGTQTLSSASNITGIEYVGSPVAGANLSFQRMTDGNSQWYSGPVSPTPGHCNGVCAGPPTVTLTGNNESCAGHDGSIAVTITPGTTGPYTLNWIVPAGMHNNPLTGLDSGTYITEVVDSYNCFRVYDTITIGRDPQPTITISQKHNETCSLSNGSAQTSLSDANPPYSYVWSSTPAQHTPVIQNIEAGTYSVTMTDALGCTATASFSIINMSGPQITIDSAVNEMCSAANASLFTTTTGGTLPLNWSWNSNPPQYGSDLLNVHAGNYTVTVKDSNNCQAIASAVLTDTPPPVIHVLEAIDEKCNKHNGSIEVEASGGSPPYTYVWNTGAGQDLTGISNLQAGTYTVTVGDMNCTANMDITISNIPGPKADFRVYPEVRTIENPAFQFFDQSTGAVIEWHWYFGDFSTGTIQNPEHRYADTGSYLVKLYIIDNEDCRDSVVKEALVIDYITLWAPDCFTPNGDGLNDGFGLSGQNITNFRLYIYDRWGELVFESAALNDYWDGTFRGKPAADGVYTWTAFYSYDYHKYAAYNKVMKGRVTLFR